MRRELGFRRATEAIGNWNEEEEGVGVWRRLEGLALGFSNFSRVLLRGLWVTITRIYQTRPVFLMR